MPGAAWEASKSHSSDAFVIGSTFQLVKMQRYESIIPRDYTYLLGDTTSKQNLLSESGQSFTVQRRRSSTTTVTGSWQGKVIYGQISSQLQQGLSLPRPRPPGPRLPTLYFF